MDTIETAAVTHTATAASLRAYIDTQDLHARDIAEFFGVSYDLVAKWLAGTRDMSQPAWRLLTTLMTLATLSPDMHAAVGPVHVERRPRGRPVGTDKPEGDAQ